MTRTCGPITGGWMRAASLDMKMESSLCPSSLCLDKKPVRTCKHCDNGGCSSEVYSTNVPYSSVCGRIIAYKIGTTDGYSHRYTNKFDGISLTNTGSNIHVWTFFAAPEELFDNYHVVCLCMNPNNSQIKPVPSYYGNHYFCDTVPQMATRDPLVFHLEDPLWDGAGCEDANQCCSFNNPPWFYRELPKLIDK